MPENNRKGGVMPHLTLSWERVNWLPDEEWGNETLPKLINIGLSIQDIRRSVYVIRLNGNFCIEYPGGESPTVYIGEGNFKQRIDNYKWWLSGLQELVGHSMFEILIAVPRVRNNMKAHCLTEAALLEHFRERYKTFLLWNKQRETCKEGYTFNKEFMDEAVCKGRGSRYKWAIKPIKNSLFYFDYINTHN
jgi:hypothetical protein